MKIEKRRKDTILHLNKKLFILLLIALLVGGGVAAYFVYQQTKNNNTPEPAISEGNQKAADTKTTSGDTSDDDSIDTSDETKNSSQEKTKDIAAIFIVDAGQYADGIEVRAYANDVSESGTCTFTFTKGSDVVTKQTEALPSAKTSSCSNLLIPPSSFPTVGTWSLIVSYASDSYTGKSDPRNIEVKK